MENIEKKGDCISMILSLPEATLDCILKRLSPTELIRMSQVCTTLRERCTSDHLWENHIKKKWGRVIGDVVYKEWQWHVTAAKEELGNNLLCQVMTNNLNGGSLGTFSGAWPMLCLGSYLCDSKHILGGSLLNNFMMALYISLESGKFWFPAQVYRGLLVSNALVSYDSKSDTFNARQQLGCWRLIGSNLQWDRVRAPPIETSPCDPHVSDCLEDLKPGDHIEVQWKGSTEIPYDWWYAVIGHLDSCNENENCCRCQYSETLIVEFRQYSQGSGNRKVKLLRKNCGEQGENQMGLYGGIRKLHSEEEIERWMQLFSHYQAPTHIAPPLYYAPPVAAQFPIH